METTGIKPLLFGILVTVFAGVLALPSTGPEITTPVVILGMLLGSAGLARRDRPGRGPDGE